MRLHHQNSHTLSCTPGLTLIWVTNLAKCQCRADHSTSHGGRGEGRGLVCNFTGGVARWWECPSWSQRSNLPQLAAVYPPTDCKHNGSQWHWADCRFIRARTRVSGEERCLALFDELVYFPCTLEAQNKPIGKRRVYQRKHSRWHWTVAAAPKPQQKSLIRAFWK